MKYTGRNIIMEAFIFSDEVKTQEELYTWKAWFISKGIFSFIHRKENGMYVLLREGKEEPTSMSCTPTEGNCKFCGKKAPHDINHYKYCSDECMNYDLCVQRREHEKA